MTGRDRSAEFDTHRRYLTAVAARILGSSADAEDAVQEAWLRLDRTDNDIDDLRAWCTRVVSRICLDQLRSRGRRAEQPLEAVPDAAAADVNDPAAHAETADRVGEALLLVLQVLNPDERLAYVLHDVFGLPFEEVAEVVERTPQAARKLASRARSRVRGGAAGGSDRVATAAQRRAVVEAFVEAAGSGDLTRLVAVLHPEVQFHLDAGDGRSRLVRGAAAVASEAAAFRRFAVGYDFQIIELDDSCAVLASEAGVPMSVLFFTIDDARVTVLEAHSL